MFLDFGKGGATGIATNIPNGEGPRPTRFCGQTYTWQEFEQARLTQPSDPAHHPGPERSARIVYRFNSRGYRCPEFHQRAQINVVSIGCSETFGVGVTDDERFSAAFCGELSRRTGKTVADFNIGIGAKSNDWIARTLTDSAPALLADVVLVCFTYMNRREHVDIAGLTYDFLPGVPVRDVPPHMRDVWERLAWLASPAEDGINLWRNYRLCQAACERAGSRLLAAHVDDAAGEVARSFRQGDDLGLFARRDVASDQVHRGPASHRALGLAMAARHLGG